MNIQKVFLLVVFIAFARMSYTQNNIGVGTISPNAKALLDLNANDKGFLVPRLTSAERLAINPVGNADAALLVYDTNDNLFYFWDGTQWVGFPQAGGSNNISLNFDANTGILSLTDAGGTLTTNIPPDNDSDPANEVQQLALNGNILNLSISNNNINLAPYLDNTDNQTLTLTGNTLAISNGNNVDLSPYAGDWKLLGNVGTNPATNFLGTTDNQALVFRTNNAESARILTNGNFGIGTATPAAKLTVRTGNIHTVNDGWSGNQVFTYNNGQEHPYFMGIRGEGTEASPTYPTNNKVLASYIGRDVLDYDAPNWGGASMYMISTENFSANAKGTRIRFSTTPNGSNVETERMTIQENGFVGIGINTPTAPLHVTGASAAVARVDRPNSNLNTHIQYSNQDGTLYAGMNSNEGFAIGSAPDLIVSAWLTVTNTGRVGIGTINPGGQFELSLDQGRKPGTNTWTIVSDARLKNIQGTYNKGLKEILQLNPISYYYKNAGERIFDKEVLVTEQIGFSAQEIQKVFPESVGIDEDGYLNLNTHAIIIAYTNAIKEQQLLIEKLQNENKTKEDQLNTLISKYESLSKEIDNIKNVFMDQQVKVLTK